MDREEPSGEAEAEPTSHDAGRFRPPSAGEGVEPSADLSSFPPVADPRLLETTLAHSAALVGFFDERGRCLYITPAAAGQGGYRAEDLVARTPDTLPMSEQVRAWVRRVGEFAQRAPAGHRALMSTETLVEPRDFELEKVRVDASAEHPAGWVVTAWDVTERLRAERRAEQMEGIYAVLSRVNQAIVRLRDPGPILAEACSAAVSSGTFALAWIGGEDRETRRVAVLSHAGASGSYLDGIQVSSRDDVPEGHGIVGRAIREQRAIVVDDVQHDEGMAPWRSHLVEHGYHAAAAFPFRLDGGRRAAFALYSHLRGSFGDDEVKLFSELAEDLSFWFESVDRERRREAAEARLRESEHRYRELFDRSPQPMWVFDVETLRFLAVNNAALHAYGYTADEFLAMTIKEIRPPEDVDRLVADVAADGTGFRPAGLWRHLRKDGSIIDVEVTAHDIEWGGRRSRLVLVTDVTERRQLEARLAQAAKMEAIGHLAGGIAHDFNNLLTAVNGYADILLTEVQDEGQREDVRQIRRAGERAAALTRQILTFARRQVIEPHPTDLNDVVTAVAPLIRRLLGERIRFVTSVWPEPLVVSADRGQLDQVLVNLAVNAADAMPAGGRLTIATQAVADAGALGRSLAGPAALLTVTDTGAGMAASVVEHIFEPFFTTKPPGKGTGLGLATVHGIVSQSGGEIWAESTPGEGSEFSILLPAIEAVPEPALALAAVSAERRARESTILVVEDEQAVRAMAVAALERAGYRVLVALTPAQAVALAEGLAEPIDLLVTDLVMPGGNGRELAARLRANLPDLPVIVMSGYDDASVAPAPDEIFLAKPFGPAELVAVVGAALAG